MRESLMKAQDASNSLIGVMNDLLGLTEVEGESAFPAGETFNLKLTGKSEICNHDMVLTSCSNKGFDSG